MKGDAFSKELATDYTDCRIVVTKETMTVEGMIKITHDLLKDKLNITKITFSSGDNSATERYKSCNLESMDRCPYCGVALDEDGVCYKCGYVKE